MDITITLDRSEKADYIYQQIYQKLKNEILSRNLPPHSKVPSKRELAEKLKVSVNSVNSAYQRYSRKGICTLKKERVFSWNTWTHFPLRNSPHLHCRMT